MNLSRKLITGMLSAFLVFTNGTAAVHAEDSDPVADLNAKVAALPESLLSSTDIDSDYHSLLELKAAYDALSEEDKAKVDFTKAEELLNFNSTTLDPSNLEKGNSLEGMTIGYLGSSITQGFRSDGIAFPEYIAQLSGSTSIKQAIPGGTLALKEGYREEVCYINQLLDGALTDVEHLDALVVQLSTNDVGAGIPIGELSGSFASADQDYRTIIGAMEFINAYAREKWDCPVMYYINAYLSDEVIAQFANGDEATEKLLHEQYQDMYEQMIDALYKVADKWDLGVADLWNDEYVRSADLDLRSFFMDDPIHPHKAGYYFWYVQPIMDKLVEITADEHVFVYDAAAAGRQSIYSSIMSPSFIIYPGVLENQTADELMEELGVKAVADELAGKVTVVTPANGREYTQADADEFVDLLGFAVSNAKVIGIGDGATFVNNFISQECWAVSGIMTFGGEMQEGLTYNVPVPVYLANASDTAKAYYTAANEGEELAYTEIGNEETAAEAFENAWNKVFKKVYRQHNEKTEFYNIPASQITDPYPLISSIIDMEEFGVNYYPHLYEPLNGEGSYCWFEYIPQAALEMEEGTVPLIVTLHGNGNDARIQGETTGWVELAAKENFMVAAPEWQTRALVEGTSETKPNFFNCDGLERDTLIEWIEMLEEKYPQIDKSRIYVTGLSAGASASTLYGALYSDVFAAVGAVSGPGVDKDELTEYVKDYKGSEVPWLYVCGDHDFFGMIPVDGSSENSFEVAPGLHIQDVDPASNMFPFIQAYQKINGLEVSEAYDMSLNEFYGIKTDELNWIKLGFKDALEGTLNDEYGPIMKVTAIRDQAHWNYKPEAEYIWNFFRDFARDTETGELLRALLTINTEKAEIATNSTLQLTANKKAEWTSSDEKIATVDENGLVTALRYGKVTITATAENGETAACDIQTRYYDVNDDSKYYYKPVYWAADKAITKGYDNVYFGPQNNCTREAVVTFLWRLAGQPEPKSTKNPFSDVQSGKYYYKAVLWAAEQGITKGYKDGTFRPDDTCLREHVVTFLYRYAGSPAIRPLTNPFNDVKMSDYYYRAAVWANQNRIANGYSTGEHAGGFGPKLDCLREHVVTFLYRYASK